MGDPAGTIADAKAIAARAQQIAEALTKGTSMSVNGEPHVWLSDTLTKICIDLAMAEIPVRKP